ncbi:MAG: hypothetical protein ACK5KT_11855 [Dysgonomonas sp.]
MRDAGREGQGEGEGGGKGVELEGFTKQCMKRDVKEGNEGERERG